MSRRQPYTHTVERIGTEAANQYSYSYEDLNGQPLHTKNDPLYAAVRMSTRQGAEYGARAAARAYPAMIMLGSILGLVAGTLLWKFDGPWWVQVGLVWASLLTLHPAVPILPWLADSLLRFSSWVHRR